MKDMYNLVLRSMFFGMITATKMFISWVFYALGIFWYKCTSSGTTVQCIWTHEVYIAQCYGSLCDFLRNHLENVTSQGMLNLAHTT